MNATLTKPERAMLAHIAEGRRTLVGKDSGRSHFALQNKGFIEDRSGRWLITVKGRELLRAAD